MEIPSSSTSNITLGTPSQASTDKVKTPFSASKRKYNFLVFRHRMQQLLNPCGTYQTAVFCFHGNKFIINGTEPLRSTLYSLKDIISADVVNKLYQSNMNFEKDVAINKPGTFYLPKLIFNGQPMPLGALSMNKMKQFIPLMLRYSTGRLRPLYGNPSTKPVWWPQDLPWHFRVDLRTEEQKAMEPFANCLRRIIWCCYEYHGRTDLLRAVDDYRKESQLLKKAFNTNRDVQKEILMPELVNIETSSLVMSVDGNGEEKQGEQNVMKDISSLLDDVTNKGNNTITLYGPGENTGIVIDGSRLQSFNSNKVYIQTSLPSLWKQENGAKAIVYDADCKENVNVCNSS